MKRSGLIIVCFLLCVTYQLTAQDLGKPFGWASVNGGTTGSGILSPDEITSSTPNVHYPTTEAEFQAALNSAKKAQSTTIVIKKDLTIIFIDGTKIDSKARNISILGQPGATFSNPEGDNGILNIKGQNIIVRNITFQGPGAVDVDGDDPLGIEGASHVWIDHCSLFDGRDGNLDIKGGSNYITISWCKFYYTELSTGHKFCNLVGHSDKNGAIDKEALKVTFALNWWGDNVRERMPRVRFGSVHCVNNLYRAPGNNYCIRAGLEANIYADHNAFVDVKNPISNNKNDICYVTLNEDDNYYKNASGTLSSAQLSNNHGALFNPYTFYSYSPVPKEYVEAVVTNETVVKGFTVTTGAGATLWQ